jgi:elongation factor P hydroxylase
MLFHDNTLSGYSPHGYGTAFIPLTCFRMIEPFVSWPGADGTSPWDVNRRPFYSGSGASNSVGIAGCGGCAKVTVANSPGWTTNQWAGYTIKRTSNVCNSTSIAYALIRSNTSNTITYHGNTGDPHSPPSLNFCAGDTFRIYKVDQALDQPGRARGSLVTGFRPVPPAGWNDQVTEPCYAWGNLDEHGAHVGFGTDERELIRVNEHFFNDTPMPGYTEYVYPHPLVSGAPPTDFNNDGKPDFVLYNPSTGQTVIWSMNNNVHVTGSYGATLPAGWSLVGVADFNNDGHPDYLLFNPSTGQTVIWYLSRTTFLAANHGPTLPSGWELVATDDFNDDGKPDLVLYNPSTRQTVVWYMNNNVHVTGSYGATIPADWSLAAVADFNGDGHPDYLLFNANTGDSVIWYLSGTTHTSGRYGSTIAAGYTLAGTADFNGDGKPDYVLYNPSTHQTAIWYMNNYLLIGTADGPTLPSGWSLVAP